MAFLTPEPSAVQFSVRKISGLLQRTSGGWGEGVRKISWGAFVEIGEGTNEKAWPVGSAGPV